MDANLVEKIVHEVKSQGVFDEFRKDSMADVDTKPAYQNLRQRVENTVKKFLSEQKWTLETNKIQLREKLRRHITESGFLDVGVERIVDQVVNPKIGSVFQPRIEEIAYKYLGLPPPPKFEPPPPPLMHPLPPLPLNAPQLKVETSSLLPTDLEQVSPDSDNATVISEGKDDRTTVDMDTDEKLVDDEDESPPFEPLIKEEIEETKNGLNLEKPKDLYSNEDDNAVLVDKTIKFERSNDGVVKTEVLVTSSYSQEAANFVNESVELHNKETSQSVDGRTSQDSQLSSVSSDSQLSGNVKEDFLQSSPQEPVAANISEEAQMPKFNENSCEQNATNGSAYEKVVPKSELHFDIKKDEIKFEGTERKTGLETFQPTAVKTEEEKYLHVDELHSQEHKNDAFKFNTNKSNTEVKEEDQERTPNAQELSFGSSIEDSLSVPASQTPKNLADKENNESPKLQTPKQTTRPTTPLLTPPLPTPTPTPSPATSLQKSEKEHQNKYSSSTSKHKKHSKERIRSYDRERDKDNSERHRSSRETKDSSTYHSSSGARSSSKQSSSSSSYSKYSSSRNKHTEKDIEKLSSSSGHSSSKHTKHTHSHSSSSSTENHDYRKNKRDSDKRHHSSSSSSKRNEIKDDHNEAKYKIQRRKSTDSNEDDGDKSLGDGKSATQNKSNYSSSGSKSSKSSNSESYKSSTSKTNGQKDQVATQEYQHINHVVILNDMLENPQVQFVQLNNKGHLLEMPLKQPPSNETETNKPAVLELNVKKETHFTEDCKAEVNEALGMSLLYFEEILVNFTDRLKLLNATMDLCRSAVNSLRFESFSDEGIELSNEEDVNSDNKGNVPSETQKRKSDYNYEEFETTPRKRFVSIESEGCQSKTSPSPSDTSSVNSKENEEIHKNTNDGKKSLLDRHKAIRKLSQQQRYSSDDLYKPRPILGQRSRRRGMDLV